MKVGVHKILLRTLNRHRVREDLFLGRTFSLTQQFNHCLSAWESQWCRRPGLEPVTGRSSVQHHIKPVSQGELQKERTHHICLPKLGEVGPELHEYGAVPSVVFCEVLKHCHLVHCAPYERSAKHVVEFH